METIKAQLTATAPMLMHSDRLSDPLAEVTKAHKVLTSDRKLKATDEGQRLIAESEYKAALYLNDKGRVIIPALNIRKSLIEGGRLYKGGKEIERGVVFLDTEARLKYGGPQNADALWLNKRFVDARSVVVSRARLMRYRPIFHEWTLETSVLVNTEIINPDNLFRYWDAAGAMCGLGDFRPLFGRYAVTFL